MNFKKLLPISIVSLGMLVGCGGNDTPVGPAFPGEKEDGTHTVEITNLEALQALWYDDGAARAVEVTIKENGQEANVPQAIAQKKLSLAVEDADVAEASGMSLSPKKLSGEKKATKVAVKYYDTVKHFQIEVTHRKSAKEYGAAHDGTLADPLTNEDALIIAKAQEAEGSFADVEYYYGGKVDSFYHTPGSRTDKICSWYMAPAEENGERFEIYSCKKQDGSQWTDDDIWEGADFVAHGKMTVYKSGSNKTYETSSAIFDSASGTKPEPRKDINATVAEALTVGKALKDGQASWDNYIVTGYVVKQSGKNYFLADTKEAAADDKDMLELYGVSTDDQAKCLKEAKITVKMNLKNYHGQIENNGTMEITVLEEGKPWVIPEHNATVAEALTACKALADGKTSDDLYIVSGLVKKVTYAWKDGTMSLTMVDAATDEETLTVYKLACTEDESKLIVENASIKVKGNLQNYVKNDAHTYELVNPIVVELPPAEGPKTDLTFNEEPAMASWADKTAYYWNDQNWCGSIVTMVEAYEQDGAYHLAYTATGACDYGLQLFYKNGDLTEGKEYTVSAKVKVEKAASIKINIDESAFNDFEAGEEKTLSIDYTEAAGKSSLKLVFKAGDAYPENKIVISDVKWVEKGGEVPPEPPVDNPLDIVKTTEVDLTSALIVEAENGTLGGAAQIESKGNAHGGKSVGYMSAGASISFKLNASAAGKAHLIVVGGSANADWTGWPNVTYFDQPLYENTKITIGNAVVSLAHRGFLGEDGANFTQLDLGEIDFEAGENILKIEALAQSANFDYIALISDLTIEEVDEKPSQAITNVKVEMRNEKPMFIISGTCKNVTAEMFTLDFQRYNNGWGKINPAFDVTIENGQYEVAVDLSAITDFVDGGQYIIHFKLASETGDGNLAQYTGFAGTSVVSGARSYATIPMNPWGNDLIFLQVNAVA